MVLAPFAAHVSNQLAVFGSRSRLNVTTNDVQTMYAICQAERAMSANASSIFCELLGRDALRVLQVILDFFFDSVATSCKSCFSI